MAKASTVQLQKIVAIKETVLEVMTSMEIWTEQQLNELAEIKIGVLRKNATQRHGVTRWKKGVMAPSSPNEVEVIDLHPELLEEAWSAYAAWVLHHEFVHALGFVSHDSIFRKLENNWPSQKSKSLGVKFTEFLRMKNAKWILKCNTCSKEYPRQKPGKKKFMCKQCRTILVDVPIKSV